MCHFDVDMLIWLVTLSRENIEIILYVQNPVDPLIQSGNFFFKSKDFDMCVSFASYKCCKLQVVASCK